MSLNFASIVLYTNNKPSLIHFLTQVFEGNLYSRENSDEFITVSNLTFKLEEVDHDIPINKSLKIQFNVDESEELNDYILNTQFYFYRSENKNFRLPEIQNHQKCQFIEIPDPDGRIWQISFSEKPYENREVFNKDNKESSSEIIIENH